MCVKRGFILFDTCKYNQGDKFKKLYIVLSNNSMIHSESPSTFLKSCLGEKASQEWLWRVPQNHMKT